MSYVIVFFSNLFVHFLEIIGTSKIFNIALANKFVRSSPKIKSGAYKSIYLV